MIKDVQFYTILSHQHQQYVESPQQVNSLTMLEIVKLVKIHQLFIIGIKNVKIWLDAKILNANVIPTVGKNFHARMVFA
jgi:hypothetical protein